MKLGTYRASDLRTAMAQLRADLGAEALILNTRRVAGGVEVQAALDQPDDGPPFPPALPHFPAARPSSRPMPLPGPPDAYRALVHPSPAHISRERHPGASEAARLTQLDWHGVPLPLSQKLRAGPLPFALSVALRFAPLNLQLGSAPLLLAGPPGSGKTLTTARLATRLVMAGLRPTIVSTDTSRAGSGEQLAAIVRLLGLTPEEVSTPVELRAVLARASAGPVLIDTAGSDPFSASDARMLAQFMRVAGARLTAVLPAGLDPGEAADLAAAYRALGACTLVATRLDLARRLGGVLAACVAGLALAELGIGSGVADGLVPASAERLASRLGHPNSPADRTR